MLKKIPLWLQVALLFVALDLAFLMYSLAAWRTLDFFELVNFVPSLSLYMLMSTMNPVPIVAIGIAGFFLFGVLFGLVLQKFATKALWLMTALLFGAYYAASMAFLWWFCFLQNCGQGILAMFVTQPDFLMGISFGLSKVFDPTTSFILTGVLFYSLIGGVLGLALQARHRKSLSH